jgi:LPXTG-motif cell wall-anchored protein
MVAVEKGAIPGVAEHGARLIVVGDSLFLANQQLELTGVKNRDFVDYAANWLLDRTQVLNGPGPQPIDEYKIVMSNAQLQSAQWVLLVGMPGAVLFLGGLVWLRRRK